MTHGGARGAPSVQLPAHRALLQLGCLYAGVPVVPLSQAYFPSLVPPSALKSGVTFNSMGMSVASIFGPTLAGLIIALGEVVDDAIIDVENILRRLRLNHEAGSPKSSFQVVLDASLEVRSAVVYATVIVVLTLVPVFFLEGLAGSFFRPLAASYILAILASLIVALTVTPALSLILLPRTSLRKRIDSALTAVLKWIYRRILPPLVRHPIPVAGLVVLVFVAAGMPFRGSAKNSCRSSRKPTS